MWATNTMFYDGKTVYVGTRVEYHTEWTPVIDLATQTDWQYYAEMVRAGVITEDRMKQRAKMYQRGIVYTVRIVGSDPRKHRISKL